VLNGRAEGASTISSPWVKGGRPRRAVPAAVALALVAALTSCSSHPRAAAPTTTAVAATTTVATTTTSTTVPATTTTLAATTTVAPTTVSTTTPAPTTTVPRFPSVINSAMQSFRPAPAGLVAPDQLPTTTGAVSAEATGLGGTYTVTLVATPSALPVNDPAISGGPGSDLGSFSTTPASSAANAQGLVTSDAQQDLAACTSTPSMVPLGAGFVGKSCATIQGSAIDFTHGPWQIQVQGSTSDAQAIATWVHQYGLPTASTGLILAVTGSSASEAIEWANGPDAYQVRSANGDVAGLALADSLRPWPG
jgi:hypothetical protein